MTFTTYYLKGFYFPLQFLLISQKNTVVCKGKKKSSIYFYLNSVSFESKLSVVESTNKEVFDKRRPVRNIVLGKK